jgi:hypothetical protein
MITKEIQEALDLLRDENLVWSSDIEDIKIDLANLLLVCAAQGDILQTLANNLARKIVYPRSSSNYDLNLERR